VSDRESPRFTVRSGTQRARRPACLARPRTARPAGHPVTVGPPTGERGKPHGSIRISSRVGSHGEGFSCSTYRRLRHGERDHLESRASSAALEASLVAFRSVAEPGGLAGPLTRRCLQCRPPGRTRRPPHSDPAVRSSWVIPGRGRPRPYRCHQPPRNGLSKRLSYLSRTNRAVTPHHPTRVRSSRLRPRLSRCGLCVVARTGRPALTLRQTNPADTRTPFC